MLKRFYPSSNFNRPELIKEYQFYLVISLVAMISEVWYFYSINYLFKTDFYNPILYPLTAINIISFLVYKKTKHFELAKVLVSASSLSFLLILLTAAGGLKSPGYSWVIMIPLLLGTLFKKRGALAGMGVIFLYTIAMIIFRDHQYVGYIAQTPEDFAKAQIENAMTFPVSAFIIIFFYLNLIEKSEREIISKKDEIDTLLKIVIHDIANPLQVAKMRIARELKSNESRNITETKMALDIITDIVKQVREIRSVTDGKFVAENSKVKIHELFDQLESIFKSQLKSKNIVIQKEFYLSKDFEYQIDPNIFKNQILNNLISNAIKFSYENSSIFIRTLTVGEYWTLEVRDHGSGIPKDKIKSIFNAHEKTSTTGTAGERGTGYGLPILKAFVEVYNGHIDIFSVTKEENKVHHGTTIRISFPLSQSQSEEKDQNYKESA
ncbi:MAG: HAMP domain-containing histidine kinase [Deltaproteobacteria bacterium]|nr:MAG: HAMP domain-containing histidine kinase [Deltaproteobacteria bacterium]